MPWSAQPRWPRWVPAVPLGLLAGVVQLVGTSAAARFQQTTLSAPAVLLLLAGPLAIVALWRWRFVPLALSVLAFLAYQLLPYPNGPIFLAPLAALGLELARGRRERAMAIRRVEQLGRERAEVEERVALARELHDVIGHSLSLINVQAGVALHLLEQQHPEHTRPALQTIKSVSHDALEEVRVVLDRLRDPQAAAERAPAATLADLPRLVAQGSGEQTCWQLVVRGERPRVPATVDAAAYRVVQESMTNVRRHAQARNATVEVTYAPPFVDPPGVRLRVSDDGRGAAAYLRDRAGEGSGISGMRERVRSVGGTFAVRTPAAGGFEVDVQIPWQRSDSEG